MKASRLVIAGVHSGVGKTTFTLALLDGLRRRGLRIQPFKCGPDYIDTSLHGLAAGRPSRNLDSFLMTPGTIRDIFRRAASGADVSVIEGVMGLFDGKGGKTDAGSTAHVAKILKAPVILVVDAWAMARSAAAMVLGYRRFDPGVRIAGVFLNRVAGEKHLAWLRSAVEGEIGVPVLGWLAKDPVLHMPERHLGLVPAAERKLPGPWLSALRRQADRRFRWDRILAIARKAPSFSVRVVGGAFSPDPKASSRGQKAPPTAKVRIAVARDEAFSFYYQDNLDMLAEAGARIVPFSPIHDRRLPLRISGLYLGGGFPEVYARALSRNAPLRRELRAAAEQGLPIYAECGGLMYLGRELTDLSGRRLPMAGVFPWRTEMEKRLKLAYVTVRLGRDTSLAVKGTSLRGHVFHFSRMVPLGPLRTAYRVSDGPADRDGYVRKNALATYVHVHFATKPALARRWVSFCRRWGATSDSGRPPSVRICVTGN